MFRRNLMVVGVALAFAAFVACSGGEADSSEEATAEMAGEESQTAMAETAETAPAQGDAMQQQAELPEGVTPEMVAEGKEIYGTTGLCYVCHGTEAEGMPGLGANLNDTEWTHSDGSYKGIVQTIMTGVEASASSTGTAMPPKGGSGITDEQVRAVAAYVYLLSQGGM